MSSNDYPPIPRITGSPDPDKAPEQAGNDAEAHILMVEDNPGDVLLLRESLEEHGVECELLVVNDGEKALALLEKVGSLTSRCPSLVILDLNLPRRSGQEILMLLRSFEACRDVPVIVFSSSDLPADREAAAALGATRYVRKPSSLEEFMKIGGVVKELLSP
ncbi:MAG: response regulator [Bryobacteraceae bacterium]|nr:response regulator [Bryobacteraceae bacterium]